MVCGLWTGLMASLITEWVWSKKEKINDVFSREVAVGKDKHCSFTLGLKRACVPLKTFQELGGRCSGLSECGLQGPAAAAAGTY